MVNDSADVTSSERSCLRAGDRKSSATNSRQSAGLGTTAIGADKTQRSIGDTCERVEVHRCKSMDDFIMST